MYFEREPTIPGEILSEEFLKPLGITQRRIAEHLSDLSLSGSRSGRNVGLDLAAHFRLCSAQFPRLLEVHPDLRRCPEVAGQPQRGVGGNAALTMQDRRDPVPRHVQRLRQ
jgi:hypothetical protein